MSPNRADRSLYRQCLDPTDRRQRGDHSTTTCEMKVRSDQIITVQNGITHRRGEEGCNEGGELHRVGIIVSRIGQNAASGWR
mmetsp:Transcript_11267/g.23766  ORF Transcript_11267/g.23766 Transcript_11267/m.23766 type:complete len:82 (-) Transcript_11267:79-324(-)